MVVNMESKTRLWRKKLSEKAIAKERILDLENSLQKLNEQLSSARSECDIKDDLISKQAKVAEDAFSGWDKAKAEAESLNLKLHDALYQKTIAEEKVTAIDADLKECVQRLHALEEEHRRTVNDASVKMSQELEKTQVLEERLVEASQRLHQLSVEKSDLCGILDMKEKLIKDLYVSKSQSEADFAAIVERFDFSEKSNESLKYEVLMLQKELMIRNQEREFNLRSAESAQKQNLQSIKKVNRLESECHRLRIMIRKRLPGPAAIAKMRSEVEMLGNSPPETQRNLNCTKEFTRDSAFELGNHDALNKEAVRLHAIEEENKVLKETIKKKNSELQISRIMYARTASKLSQVEKKLKELINGSTCLEPARSSSVTYELSLPSVSEAGNEDDANCTEPWSSSFMSQLEQLRIENPETPHRTIGSSQSSLMDDFEEMEKLAIICADKPEEGSSIISGEDLLFLTPKSVHLRSESLEFMAKEQVMSNKSCNSREFDHGDHSFVVHHKKHPIWLQDILKVIVQKHYTTQLNLDVILHDVIVALSMKKPAFRGNLFDSLLDNVCLEPHHSSSNSADGSFVPRNLFQSETGNQLLRSMSEKALHRIIELIEGSMRREIADNDRELLISSNDGTIDPLHDPASSNGLTSRIFLCESSEFTMILQRFIDVCGDMSSGQADFEKFVGELASTLGWIIKHCFSFHDVSALEEILKKKFGDVDAEVEANGHKEANYEKGGNDKFKVISDGLYILSKMDIIGSKIRDENRKLKHKIKSVEYGNKDDEEILKSASAKNHSLVAEQNELQNEAFQKFSSLEAEELGETCLELQLQVESASEKDISKYDMVPEEKELRTDCRISAASDKLAECQETILQLGKQLKALASPKDLALFDSLIQPPPIDRKRRSPQLLEQLIAIDNAKFEDLRSPQTKEIICSDASFLHVGIKGCVDLVSEDQESRRTEVGAIVSVPKKQKGGIFFLKKLLLSKRKTTRRSWT